MPRISHGLADNQYYHLLNQGNGQQQVFLCEDDYRGFLDLIDQAKERLIDSPLVQIPDGWVDFVDQLLTERERSVSVEFEAAGAVRG